MTSLGHLELALSELRAAERDEGCAWCKSHVTEVRILTEDLVHAAQMSEDLGRGELTEFSKRVGRTAERIGALGMLARIVHRVKGVG